MGTVFTFDRIGRPSEASPLTVTDVEFVAWIAQALPGDVLEYHRGMLAIDRDFAISKLGRDACERIDHLADCALDAAEEGLVHLVQKRLGEDHFSYRAIARPKTEHATQSLSTIILKEAA